jgi:hypothetical protein
MSIQQQTAIQINLIGDGVSTSFTYSFSKLYETISNDGGQVTAPSTLPTSVSISSVNGNVPTGGTASLDGFGNLVLNFPSFWTGLGACIVNLEFASGTLAGTTQAWTSATAVNSVWNLPLNGAATVLVPIVVTGAITVGVVGFFASADGTNWLPIQGTPPAGFQPLTGWNLTSGNTAALFDVSGYSYFRVQLTTAITGTGTVTFIIQSQANPIASLITAGVVGSYNAAAPTTANFMPVQCDSWGDLFVKPYRRSQIVSKPTTITTTAVTTIMAAQAAGIFADISTLIVTATSSATAAAFTVTLSDGTLSYIYDMNVDNAVGSQQINLCFDPPLSASSAATAWTLTSSVAETLHVTCVAVLQKVS